MHLIWNVVVLIILKMRLGVGFQYLQVQKFLQIAADLSTENSENDSSLPFLTDTTILF